MNETSIKTLDNLMNLMKTTTDDFKAKATLLGSLFMLSEGWNERDKCSKSRNV